MQKIKITSLDHYGRGIGKINNKVVFLENSLPDEILEYEVTKEKKSFIEANCTNIIKKSKKRTEAICPYYNKCGGCNLMHMDYNYQLKFKENKIKNIISKYLDDNIKINDIIGSDNSINYRNKVTLQVDKHVGFYKKKTNDIIPIEKCFLINDKINNIISKLNKLDLDNIKNITCRTNKKDIMLILYLKNNINKDNIINILKDKCSSIIINYKNEFKCIYGNDYIINDIDDLKFKVTNDGFFQINENVTFKLYSKIRDLANLKGNEFILDLYCGSGTIGMFLASHCKKVIGIDINKSSIDCAIENIKLNNIKNCDFICDNLDNFSFNCFPDVTVVDPPRSGLGKKTIDEIIKLNSNTIIYVSCDPMTLTKDLNILKKYYKIKEISIFDMFPNTYHVETITLLQKI